jgi:hypothetical protein
MHDQQIGHDAGRPFIEKRRQHLFDADQQAGIHIDAHA